MSFLFLKILKNKNNVQSLKVLLSKEQSIFDDIGFIAFHSIGIYLFVLHQELVHINCILIYMCIVYVSLDSVTEILLYGLEAKLQ
jgi:hypothetical protein